MGKMICPVCKKEAEEKCRNKYCDGYGTRAVPEENGEGEVSTGLVETNEEMMARLKKNADAFDMPEGPVLIGTSPSSPVKK